ncbi:ABC transporter substrate-binding protein [Actinosynnema sp. ALI-1.44]|uniref:ABC transporter substrate-binding protein n=1 Tax=Actinosynnema sp. ALI-1.44 TaxID=1933779 RepID=UPI00192CF881|nr:ABC transporter substrate-binding protein [Actinosynnema sp. ALI-1.44]
MKRTLAVALVAVLGLAGCVGPKVAKNQAGSGGSCGHFKLAVNPWVGYEANAAVIAYVAEKNLGCRVTKKDLKEEVAWQGFGTGEVDAVVENWGHDDLRKKYIDEQKIGVSAGSTGVKGEIGWYVPPWLAKQHPELLDWNNLNKYAEMFRTSESGGQGQLLDGDPSFVTNDEALVKNLGLNFKVVYGGSETALIQAFRQAEERRTPLIGYFYSPQWLFTEVKLERVKLPAHTPGCDEVAEKIACDYPDYDLDKIVSRKFANANGPAYQLVRNFQWTNDDQNIVARWIAVDKMSPEAAAKRWVEQNPDKVKAWLPVT